MSGVYRLILVSLSVYLFVILHTSNKFHTVLLVHAESIKEKNCIMKLIFNKFIVIIVSGSFVYDNYRCNLFEDLKAFNCCYSAWRLDAQRFAFFFVIRISWDQKSQSLGFEPKCIELMRMMLKILHWWSYEVRSTYRTGPYKLEIDAQLCQRYGQGYS